MSNEQGAELSSTDAGIAVGAAPAAKLEPPQGQAEGGTPEPMSAETTAAVTKLAELRKDASNPSLSHNDRDAIMQKMSELSKHAFLGEKMPAWYQAKPDAKDTSTEAYDGLAEELAKASEPMTDAQHEQIIREGMVQGCDRVTATLAADFAQKAGLNNVTATVIAKRAAHHDTSGWGIGQLTEQESIELAHECARRFGSNEKALEQIGLAEAYLKHMNLLDWAEKHAGSLAYDPHIILMLAYKARVLGLKVKS